MGSVQCHTVHVHYFPKWLTPTTTAPRKQPSDNHTDKKMQRNVTYTNRRKTVRTQHRMQRNRFLGHLQQTAISVYGKRILPHSIRPLFSKVVYAIIGCAQHGLFAVAAKPVSTLCVYKTHEGISNANSKSVRSISG